MGAKRCFTTICSSGFWDQRSIVTELYRRGVAVTLFPPTVQTEDILGSGCSAMLLSNGPGDPERLRDVVSMTKQVIAADFLSLVSASDIN
nr:hypothetical protein [uncultured Sphaerochaeta sp.]